MDDREDAYGQIVWDYFQGRDSYEVVERDDGYIDVPGGPKTYFAPYRAWPAPERRAMRYVQGRVLDVGCGAGRVALYLQSRGFAVTGIDTSPLAIKVCKLRGVRRAQVMSVTDLRFRPRSFDTVVLFGNNFGLLSDARRAPWLLRRFHRITEPEGLILTESLDPQRTENLAHLAYHQRNRERGRLPGQVRLRVRYGRYATRWFDYLFVSAAEMRTLLRGTGWRVKTVLPSKGVLYVAVLEKDDAPA